MKCAKAGIENCVCLDPEYEGIVNTHRPSTSNLLGDSEGTDTTDFQFERRDDSHDAIVSLAREILLEVLSGNARLVDFQAVVDHSFEIAELFYRRANL